MEQRERTLKGTPVAMEARQEQLIRVVVAAVHGQMAYPGQQPTEAMVAAGRISHSLPRSAASLPDGSRVEAEAAFTIMPDLKGKAEMAGAEMVVPEL